MLEIKVANLTVHQETRDVRGMQTVRVVEAMQGFDPASKKGLIASRIDIVLDPNRGSDEGGQVSNKKQGAECRVQLLVEILETREATRMEVNRLAVGVLARLEEWRVISLQVRR